MASPSASPSTSMPLVIVESPFAPSATSSGQESDEELQFNISYARQALRDCLLRGEAPYASHLLFPQKGILDDRVPGERKLGIEAGLQWGKNAERSVVYCDLGVSRGMEIGIERAHEDGRPVEFRDGLQLPDPPRCMGDPEALLGRALLSLRQTQARLSHALPSECARSEEILNEIEHACRRMTHRLHSTSDRVPGDPEPETRATVRKGR